MRIHSRLWLLWGLAVALPLTVTASIIALGDREPNASDAGGRATVEEVGPRFAHAYRQRVESLADGLARLAEDHTLRMTDATVRPHDWEDRVRLAGMKPEPAWVRAFNLTNPQTSAPTDRRSWRLLAAQSPRGWSRLVAGRDSLELGTLVEGDAAAIVVARFSVKDIATQSMADIGSTDNVSYFVADPERRRFVHHSHTDFGGRPVLDLYPDLRGLTTDGSGEVLTTPPSGDARNHHIWMQAWPDLGMVLGVARAERLSVPAWIWTKRGLLALLTVIGVLSFGFVVRAGRSLNHGLSELGPGVDPSSTGDLAHRRVLNRLANQLRETEGRRVNPEARTGDTEERLYPADLPHFLERTVRDSGALADGRLQIAVDVARDVESIAVDDPNLRRTVLVLIDNARRAMPRGGELRIEARREGDDAVIHVVDTGVGMSPYFMQHHLFRPFVAEWDTGDGLGLSLVEAREAARRGGGDLEVASREGIGTRVSIFRPLASFDLGNEPHDVPFSRVG